MTYSEVEEVDGFVGNFEVKIRKKARSVDVEVHRLRGLLREVPGRRASRASSTRASATAARSTRPFPQAVRTCRSSTARTAGMFTSGKCGVCQKVCPSRRSTTSRRTRSSTEKFGAIVVATGFDLEPGKLYGEYGYGKYPDVISGLQFERMMNASGPTDGKIVRPSDGKSAEDRSSSSPASAGATTSTGMPYCSKVCCMYNAKQALLVKDKLHDVADLRLLHGHPRERQGLRGVRRRTIEELRRELHPRPRLADLPGRRSAGRAGRGHAAGQAGRGRADLVVLATAMQPQPDAKDLARKLGISTDSTTGSPRRTRSCARSRC